MTLTPVERIIDAIWKIGVRIDPTEVTDFDTLALVLPVALANVAATRRVRFSLSVAYDEGKHPREAAAHDGKKPGEFAPKNSKSTKATKGKGKPSPTSQATSGEAQRREQLRGRRGRFLEKPGAKRRPPSVKAIHAALLKEHAVWREAEKRLEKHFDDCQALADKLEAALAQPQTENDVAVVNHYREQCQIANTHLDHLLEESDKEVTRMRQLLTSIVSRRVRNPARLKYTVGDGYDHSAVKDHGELNPSQKAALDDAHDFIAKMCNLPPGATSEYKLVASRTGRACCVDASGGPVVATGTDFAGIGPDEQQSQARRHATRVHVHELGHALEFTRPGLRNRALTFLEKRTAGEKPVKLADVFPTYGYEDHEYGSRDDFDKAFGERGFYVGKKYDEPATEVVSMGLELLWANPAKLARDDPEMFHWLLTELTR